MGPQISDQLSTPKLTSKPPSKKRGQIPIRQCNRLVRVPRRPDNPHKLPGRTTDPDGLRPLLPEQLHRQHRVFRRLRKDRQHRLRQEWESQSRPVHALRYFYF